MTQAVSDPAELLRILDINPQKTGGGLSTTAFRLKVPAAYIRRMQKGDVRDPLLRQVLPLQAENEWVPGFTKDPVGDMEAMSTPGLLHKYAGRALLVVTGACAIHCRYCFRRHFPYGEANLSHTHWEQALQYLRENTDIREIILSGGDPLSVPDSRLAEMLKMLEAIPHLNRLRIHTRLPVVIPDRVTPELLTLLKSSRFQNSIVLHINHPQEIDQELGNALAAINQQGVTLLNQAVLLAGINDSVEVQVRLSEALFEHRVLPYYLHMLDPVQGSAHFEVSRVLAEQIHEGMRQALPGYLLPRLVREVAGSPYKTPIESICN
jgi:EF-P beta-lysylation protein EpmB